MISINDYVDNINIKSHNYKDKECNFLFTSDILYEDVAELLEEPYYYKISEVEDFKFKPIRIFSKSQKFVLIMSISDFNDEEYTNIPQFYEEAIIGILVIANDFYNETVKKFMRNALRYALKCILMYVEKRSNLYMHSATVDGGAVFKNDGYCEVQYENYPPVFLSLFPLPHEIMKLRTDETLARIKLSFFVSKKHQSSSEEEKKQIMKNDNDSIAEQKRHLVLCKSKDIKNLSIIEVKKYKNALMWLCR